MHAVVFCYFENEINWNVGSSTTIDSRRILPFSLSHPIFSVSVCVCARIVQFATIELHNWNWLLVHMNKMHVMSYVELNHRLNCCLSGYLCRSYMFLSSPTIEMHSIQFFFVRFLITSDWPINWAAVKLNSNCQKINIWKEMHEIVSVCMQVIFIFPFVFFEEEEINIQLQNKARETVQDKKPYWLRKGM